MLALVRTPGAALAAGAYVVDDAEVTPGECKLESWISLATNHGLTVVTKPGCAFKFGLPVEVNAGFVRFRSESKWATAAGPLVKINLLPVEKGRFGVALAATAGWNLSTREYQGEVIYVPVTYTFSDEFRVNLNAGWQYDKPTKLSYAYWGASFEWTFAKSFKLIGEAFGLQGGLPEVDEGEAPSPRSRRAPRAQVGLRFTPVKNADIDLIYGQNVQGENAHWLTLGLNLRF